MVVRNRTICVAVHHVRLDWPFRTPENGRYFADSLIGPVKSSSSSGSTQGNAGRPAFKEALDSGLRRRPASVGFTPASLQVAQSGRPVGDRR